MSDNKRNIELEIRAEISQEEFRSLFNALKRKAKLISEKNRLSTMFFGSMNNERLDVRVRITNGEAEVVAKKGDFHKHNRIEVTQEILPGQFIGLVKLIFLFGFEVKVKVGPRTIFDFDMGDGIVLTLAHADNKYYYVEIEKMTNKDNEEKDREELQKIANELNLKIVNREEFHNLCTRLTEDVDWNFSGREEDYRKLERELEEHVEKYKK